MIESDLLVVAKEFVSSAKKVVFLRKSHNLIFKVYDDQKGLFILRLTSIHHRCIEQIIGELDFQQHLFDNGCKVVCPLKTQNNTYCVYVELDDSPFHAAAFSFALGNNWDDRCDFTENRFFMIGKELGKIHRISKGYAPRNKYIRRQWNESQHIIKADKIFMNYNINLHMIFSEFMSQMKEAPKNRNCFGLTHGDYLLSNYMIDTNDQVTIFDFDECEYSWFAADLAICMHCYLIGADPHNLPNRANDAKMMHYHLLRGYITENELCEEMISGLEPFFKMRDFIYLSTILEKQTPLHEWDKGFILTCVDRIMNNKGFLAFDAGRPGFHVQIS